MHVTDTNASMIAPDNMPVVANRLRKARRMFDEHAAVHRSVSERMLERLSLLAIRPQRVLDLGCRSGYQLSALQARYPDAAITGVDPVLPDTVAGKSGKSRDLLRKIRLSTQKSPKIDKLVADPHSLPLADASIDLVVSNLFLPWCEAPPAVFREVARVLAPNGAFMFTSAGPDTLQEYREVWACIDADMHVFGLVDMHDLGDAMLSAGFAAPVLDRENILVDYPSIGALQQELQSVGAGNLAIGRRAGLMSPSVRERLATEASRLHHENRFAVTLELVQGHAWKGQLPRDGHNTDDGYAVSLESLQQSLRGGR